MDGKFYIKKLIRDDGAQLIFDSREIYLSDDNSLLARSPIQSTDVEYTDYDGGEMIAQRNMTFEQPINGVIFPRTTEYWILYQKLAGFFLINHTYKIITAKKTGAMFAQQQVWISDGGGLQLAPQPFEDYSNWSVTMRIGNMSLYEYAEDSDGNEIFANSTLLPLISASTGGGVWDEVGGVWDEVGGVWEAGSGGVQNVNIASVAKIYPVWTVQGSAVNPSLQNNTTDMVATYNGTVAAGQTLVVNFATGEARLDGALVSRNITGQVSFNPGDNMVGFNSDGGSATNSKIEWNNVIG